MIHGLAENHAMTAVDYRSGPLAVALLVAYGIERVPFDREPSS